MRSLGDVRGRAGRPGLAIWAALTAGVPGVACDREEPTPTSASAAPSASTGPMGLSADLSKKVLARVGDRVITLGDYAATLERMDPFERLRYQTEDRRKQLLEEMIDIELLAQEAERRGLDQKPAARQLVRQLLRDEVLSELREQQPALDELPSSEVRAYYEAHRDDFREPERRRISAIVLPSAQAAKKVLSQAVGADAVTFGKLVDAHSIERRPKSQGPRPPTELAGDRGFVVSPGGEGPNESDVPDAVVGAAFEIEKQGDVLDRVVSANDKHYIIRLVSISSARDRSLSEAERTIRVALLRDKLRAAEEAYEDKLRKQFSVAIDEDALAGIGGPDKDEKDGP